MRRLSFASATLIFAACGAGAERPEPPSGAVDPGVHGLATPGERAPARGPASGSGADPGLPALPAVQGTAPPASPPAAGEVGTVVMTRDHCEALGRKFAELAMGQGGEETRGRKHPEAEGVARTFTDRCTREMVGQAVPLAEYHCMLRAKAADALLACKR